MPDVKTMPGNAMFTPKRLVINLAVVDFNADEHDLKVTDFVTTFDPPIKINVGYHIQDLYEAARDSKTLKLGYWDSYLVQWVVFSRTGHKFQLFSPSTATVCEIHVSEWPADPPIGWGK